MVPLLLIISITGIVCSEPVFNGAEPVGQSSDGYNQDNAPDYPTDPQPIVQTDIPTEYPTIPVEPTPEEEYGWISIRSVPSGAMVTFDGS
ncbi:hypothetical protein, partial [Methanospirillum sp.]